MKRLMLAFAAVAAVAALVGCGPRGGPQEEQAAPSVPVRVTQIEAGSVVESVTSSGTVKARHDVPISAEAGGRVVEVPARVGDWVSSGDVLVRLDDELAALALRQAEARLLQAEAELDDAEAALGRSQRLWESGDIADAEFEAAERRAKLARAAFATAEAGRGTAERQLRNTAIESPIQGTVAFVHAKKGHTVAAGTAVAHVVDDSVVEIELGLSEDQVSDMRPGRPAEVRVRALPGEILRGKVEYVGRRASDATRTYPVRVVLSNRDRRLRSGMVAEVEIAAREYEDVIAVERDWVVERYGEPAVYVASDSLAVLRRLTLGRVVGNRVIVASGLAEGDLMVTFGHDRLTDGARIDIKDAPADSSERDVTGSGGR